MAHTRANRVARTLSSSNPVSFSMAVSQGDTVLVLLLNVVGAAVRGGGAPTYDGVPMTQASTQQIAAASPEASAEIWYVLNPLPGNRTVSIPNSGSLAIRYTVEAGQAEAGGSSALDGANGNNATGTNPSPGAVTITQSGDVAWSIIAGGAQTWSPSAQVGTAIANTDDGATGGGEQYALNPAVGSLTLSWTFGTSEDYGAVAVAFKEVPPLKLNNQITRGLRAGGSMGVTEKIGNWGAIR